MNRPRLLRGTALTVGALLAVTLIVLGWRQSAERPGRLPTAEERKAGIHPAGVPIAGGADANQRATLRLPEDRLKDGKPVKINVPGGGSVVISPGKEPPIPAPDGNK